MSMIDGPTKISPSALKESNKVLDEIKGAVGMPGVRLAESLLGIRFDPAPAYLFYVSISSLVVGLFTSCDGLTVRREVEEIKEGGLNDQIHILPGPMKAGRVTLKRGVTVNRELWDWFTEGLFDNKVKRVNVSITQGAPGMSGLGAIVGKAGSGTVKTWNLQSAFPVSYSISGLNVDSTTQVAIESIEIACQTITLSKLAGLPMSPMALFT